MAKNRATAATSVEGAEMLRGGNRGGVGNSEGLVSDVMSNYRKEESVSRSAEAGQRPEWVWGRENNVCCAQGSKGRSPQNHLPRMRG